MPPGGSGVRIDGFHVSEAVWGSFGPKTFQRKVLPVIQKLTIWDDSIYRWARYPECRGDPGDHESVLRMSSGCVVLADELGEVGSDFDIW